MIAFHADGNLILQQAFKSKSDRHQIAAYNAIMTRLAARGLLVDLQILDNEASAEYKEAITFKWNAKFQLVPPDMHHQNQLNALFAHSRTTSWQFLLASTPPFHRTFGTFFCHRLNSPSIFSVRPLSIQGLVHGNFSKAPLTSTRRRLARLVITSSSMQSRLLGNLGTSTRNQASILVLPLTLDSYRCFKLVKSNTKSQVISDNVKFCHLYLSIPVSSAKDEIIHGLQIVAGAIRGAQLPASVTQLEAITSLQGIFESWCTLAPPSLGPTHRLAPSPPRVNSHKSPRVVATSPPSTSPTWSPSTAVRSPLQPATSSPTPALAAPTFYLIPCRLVFGDDHSPRLVSEPQEPLLPPSAQIFPVWEPTTHCNRSWAPAALALFAPGGQFHECVQYRIPTAKFARASPVAMGFAGLCAIHHMTTAETSNFAPLCSALLHKDNPLALSNLDPTTGNMLEHCQLQCDPQYKRTWDTLYSNDLGHLCQGIGSGKAPNSKRVAGNNP
jgi:hypothetical protein